MCRYAQNLAPLPANVMSDVDMRILWDETNIIVWACVDLP
jgi:hypothetical protein